MMPVIEETFLGYNVVFWYGMAVVAAATAIFVTVCWCLPPKKGASEK